MIKLVKLEELPTAEVPNNKPVGYEKEGTSISSIEIGKSVYLFDNRRLTGGFITSIVTEIIDDNTFKTLNSIYKIIRDETN